VVLVKEELVEAMDILELLEPQVHIEKSGCIFFNKLRMFL